MLLLKGNGRPAKCCKSSSLAAHGSNSQGKNFGEAQKIFRPQKCCSTRCDEKNTSNSPPAHGSNSQGKNIGETQKNFNPQKCCSTRCDGKKTSNSPPAQGSNSHGKIFGEAQKNFSPQKCCSTRCDEKKTTSCANEDHLINSEHMDHGSSEIDSPCMAANEIHKHGCEEKDCTNIVGRNHTICISGDENHKHGGEHCDHEHNKDDNQPKHSHLNQSSCGLAQTITTDGHCHLIHCTKNSVQDHDVDSKTPNVAATGCHQTDNEACFECNGHIEEDCPGLHPTKDSLLESNHMGCAATKACPSLESRQISGCCSSFRKDCCGKTGHFGLSFSGGLSEIIIE